MYKMKLQELCHRRRWALPTYSALRDGPDHFPRFKASVSVNGLSFHSRVSCKSCKEAQNEAARLAFLHFSGSSVSYDKPNAQGTDQAPHLSQSHALGVKDDTNCQYKSHLQNYARWRNCDLPLYSSSFEGPPHSRCFKATVTVDGHTFESLDFFKTLKEAEQSAAKVALTSLTTTDGFQESDCGVYKNLLQELAQKEGFSIPVYKTIKSDGAPHMATFISSVELEEEIIFGKVGKSKKEAEIKAAKVAYTLLMERAMNRTAKLARANSSNSSPLSDFLNAIDSEQIMENYTQVMSNPEIVHGENSAETKGGGMRFTNEVQEVDLDEVVSSVAKVTIDNPILSPDKSVKEKVTGTQKDDGMFAISITEQNVKKDKERSVLEKCEESDEVGEINLDHEIASENSEVVLANSVLSLEKPVEEKVIGAKVSSSCTECAPAMFEESDIDMSSSLRHPNSSTLSISEPNVKDNGTKTYLLCNRFRVYSCYPDISFPKGITLLPVSEERWMAVSLEFPAEKNH
ncbi:hypothetical protein Tsubulata_044584 [Turnera subulata]|uniref:DRBM domain-containing protein n=1 Tax=Turnera subulata TaxID=218843 RepID=A0A9Q0GHC4_9ROSI|nr:hypothetical protein Tsubulata_044584 [Turnera subulata]